MDIIRKINGLSLPATILIASIVLGGFVYASQVNKQKSIERQLEIKLLDDKRAEEAKAEQDKEADLFSNNLRCQALLKDLKQRWNNVVGIYYSDYQNTCIVKYTKQGVTEESAIEDMQDAD